jgi:L-lactate utilization protein LutC
MSSINHIFVVKDSKKVEALAESMERASAAPKYKSSTSCTYITSGDEINRFLEKRRKNHESFH